MPEPTARPLQQILRDIFTHVHYPITRADAIDLAADAMLPLDDGAGVSVRDLLEAVPDAALASQATLTRALFARWTAIAGSLRPFAAASGDPDQ